MVLIGYTDLDWTAHIDDHSHEARQLTQVGSATVFVIETSFLDSKNAYKSCKIEQIEVETGDILTKMEASIVVVRRLQSFAVQHNAERLTMAHALGSCWFPGLLEPSGFKLCDCKRVRPHGLHFCMVVATMDAEIRANVVASEKGEDTMPMVAPGSGLVHSREPSEPASQEVTDTFGMIAEDLTDDTAKKATAYGTIAIRSRPATKIVNHKEYCSYWIRKGECDYTQIGCKYKHEMPVDEETLLSCGFRKVPLWFMDSPMYEEYLQKKRESATGRLAGASAEGKATSTAESSRKSSGRRGENVTSSQGAGRTLLTPTLRRDARQLVSQGVRSPYDNDHQGIVTPQPDTKSIRAGPPSAANTNVTGGTAVQQLERQTYEPAGATASSTSIRGAAEGSSKVKDGDVKKVPRRQARNNGGFSLAAGSPHLRQFQQALLGSRPASNSAGSMMGAGRGEKGAKTGRNEG